MKDYKFSFVFYNEYSDKIIDTNHSLKSINGYMNDEYCEYLDLRNDPNNKLIAMRLGTDKISKCGDMIFEGDILEMDKIRGVVTFFDDAFFLDYGEISEYLRYIDTSKFNKVGTIYDK